MKRFQWFKVAVLLLLVGYIGVLFYCMITWLSILPFYLRREQLLKEEVLLDDYIVVEFALLFKKRRSLKIKI